ncbi:MULTISPECIES: hypothetical protein [unclassified Lacinutrix]
MVSIKHPGEDDFVEVILTEVQNKNGLPIEYYMDVKSVICLAEVCKVIPVTLYWNNIGQYKKYQIKKGVTLEKYEADIFEPNDYKKLQNILENSDSPFRDVFLEDIWTVPSAIDQDVDAISGATILSLDEKDTVPGAALTCYTLWHWANGNIVSVIKEKTSKSVSNSQLKNFITNDNHTYFNIALKELEQRNIYKADFVDIIIYRVLKDDFLLKNAFGYLEKARPDTYLYAVSEVFFQGEKKQKLSAIRSLNNSEIDIPKLYLDRLSEKFKNLESYQEVSSLFELMQNKNPNSSTVNKNVISLLDSDIFIARRAYWFLSNQKLTSKQEKKFREFQRKNKDKL